MSPVASLVEPLKPSQTGEGMLGWGGPGAEHEVDTTLSASAELGGAVAVAGGGVAGS